MEELGCILLDAIKSGNGSLVIAALLCLVVFLVRSVVAPKVAFFSSDIGGATLALSMGVSSVLLAATTNGEALSLALLGKAFSLSLTAMGGYASVKKLFAPYLVRLAAKLGLPVSLEMLSKALEASEPKTDLQKR